MPNGLVDEYRLMVHPVVLGDRMRLFRYLANIRIYTLVDTKALSSGIVVLTYQPDKKDIS